MKTSNMNHNQIADVQQRNARLRHIVLLWALAILIIFTLSGCYQLLSSLPQSVITYKMARPYVLNDGSTLLGRGGLVATTVAPDGTMIAVATTIGVWVYNLREADNGILLPHSAPVVDLQWSPDSSQIVTAVWNDPDRPRSDNLIRIWDVSDPQNMSELAGHDAGVLTVDWSPDGTQIVSSGYDETIRIWDITNGNSEITLFGHTNSITDVAWSPDGSTIASTSTEGTIRLWDIATSRTVNTITVPELNLLQYHRDLSWSPDGSMLSMGVFNHILLWDPATGEKLTDLENGKESVTSVRWSSDGAQVAGGSMDGTVRIWDATQYHMIAAHDFDMFITNIDWSSPQSKIWVANGDGSLNLWDIASDQVLSSLDFATTALEYRGLSSPVSSIDIVDWSPDGSQIAAAGATGQLMIWDVDDTGVQTVKSFVSVSRPRNEWINDLHWSPDGERLVTTRAEDIAIWKADSGELIQQLSNEDPQLGSPAGAVRWSPDGTLIAVVAYPGIALWDVASGKLLTILQFAAPTDQYGIPDIAWSPDSTRLASIYRGNSIYIWDISSQTTESIIEFDSEQMTTVSWSPNGLQLAFGTVGGTIHLFDLEHETISPAFAGHTDEITGIDWSPNGELLATSAQDRSVHIWNAATYESIQIFTGQADAVTSISWAPNGTSIASGSNDGTVRIWPVDGIRP